MAFDNQLEKTAETLDWLLHWCPVFFGGVVLNRMFAFNDPELQTILRERDSNRVLDLAEAGGIVFIKSDSTLYQDWKGTWRDRSPDDYSVPAPAGVTRDGQYILGLSQDLERRSPHFVPFTTEDTTPRFFAAIRDIWQRLDGRLKDRVADADRARMRELFEENDEPPEGFRRATLLLLPTKEHPWSLDIPIRDENEGNRKRYAQMMNETMERGPDPELMSKRALKQVIDAAYNRVMPGIYRMALAYHDVWPEILAAMTDPPKRESALPKAPPERTIEMAHIDSLSFAEVAELLADPDFARQKASLGEAVTRLTSSTKYSVRSEAILESFESLTEVANATGRWAQRTGRRTTPVRVAAAPKHYYRRLPGQERPDRIHMDVLSIQRGESRGSVIEFDIRVDEVEGNWIATNASDEVSERVLEGAGTLETDMLDAS